MQNNKLVRDIMTQDVRVISPGSTIREAAKLMDEFDVGAVPVCDNDRLVGIVTDRDIVIRSVSAGQDPNTATVRDSMTSPINWCFEEQEIGKAAKMMQERQIRRLVVLNNDKRLVGIVTLEDLAARHGDKIVVSEIAQKVAKASRRAA